MSRPSTPARASRASRLRWLRARGRVGDLLRDRRRHDDDAVVIGDDHVARGDQRAAHTTGNVHRAERRLDRALGTDRAAPHREVHLRSSTCTSRTPPSMTRPPAPRALKLVASRSPKKPSVVGRDGGDDDVARLDLLGRDVQHPVVARLQQHGHGRAARLRAGVDRTHVRLHQADAAHRLVHGRRRRIAPSLSTAARSARLMLRLTIPSSSHDQCPLASSAASRRG